MRILIVCLGNICRSPMAEGVLRKKISERKLSIEVDSAGTANYHVDEGPDARAIQAARSYDIDISNLRGRQFSINDFDKFDYIYAMDNSNFRNITKLARNKNDLQKVHYFYREKDKGIDVPDPWFGEPEGFYPVLDLLDKAADKIIDELLSMEKSKA